LAARVRRAIIAHELVPARSRVVVAVSGGVDSVALLHLLAALREERRLHLHVAHLDHALREASREDAEFVRRLAARWGLPATVERRPVAELCARQGWSLEDGARRVRYAFLIDTAARSSASHVALAHTADDQAETVLMRVLRGSGLLGLGAMPIKRQVDGVWLIRPLLDVWRRELVAYARAQRLSYREDPTNRDERFLRNRIRHELLPLIERRYNPNIKGALTQLAQQCRTDYEFLQGAAGRQWKRMTRIGPSAQVTIAITPFLRQPKALQRQVVREALQRVKGDLTRIEYRHWLEVERLFTERPTGTVVDLPGGVSLRREEQRVVCRLAPTPTS
jgi:tRNA(Ile)-lysidine synthase